MGILSIANACSHLQNASRARLGITSIPNTKYNFRLALALHRAGFISSVVRAGVHPPDPLLADDLALQRQQITPVLSSEAATTRLWLGLKYWNNEPVMRRLQIVSRPSCLVTTQLGDLSRIARGFPSSRVKGLNLGECIFLSTDRGVLELREALERKVGGLVLCRVSG